MKGTTAPLVKTTFYDTKDTMEKITCQVISVTITRCEG